MSYVVIATQRLGVVELDITRHYWILCSAEDFRQRLEPLLPRDAQTLPTTALVREKAGAMLIAAQKNSSSQSLRFYAVAVSALEAFFATFALAEVE